MYYFHLLVILISLTAGLGYINTRWIKLPNSIGLMLMSILFSILVMISYNQFNLPINGWVQQINNLNFSQIVFDVMLSSLLFAGGLHLDVEALRKYRTSVMIFALSSVFISTFMIATFMYYLVPLFTGPIPFLVCLIFGSFISPTDPIAVLNILNKTRVPQKVKINIVGESLFNDGIAVVLFIVLMDIYENTGMQITPLYVSKIFLQEAGGGLLMGYILGNVTFYLLKTIDNYEVALMITLSIVLGGSWLASELHVSGPLAMVIAGLFMGRKTKENTMSEEIEFYVDGFWHLIDVILNSLLFVLIGLKVISFKYNINYIMVSLISIPVFIFIRYLSLEIPFLATQKINKLDRKAIYMMTWGGLRGGLSIAMALSMPNSILQKDFFVSLTYLVVLFSILVQGLTFQKVANYIFKPQ